MPKRLTITWSPNERKEKRWPNKYAQARAFSSGLTGYSECQHWEKANFLYSCKWFIGLGHHGGEKSCRALRKPAPLFRGKEEILDSVRSQTREIIPECGRSLAQPAQSPCDFIRAEGAWPWNSTIEEGRVRGTGSDILPLLSNNPDITPTNTKIPFLRETRKRTQALDSDGTGLNPGCHLLVLWIM